MDDNGINEHIDHPRNTGQDGTNGRPKRRRIMTDRRREQNRQAQKNHRERHKRRLQELSGVEVQSKNSNTSNLSSDGSQNVSKSPLGSSSWIDIGCDNEVFESAVRELETNGHSIDSNSEANLSKASNLDSVVVDEINLLQSGATSLDWNVLPVEPESGIWPGDANPQTDPSPVPQNLLSVDSVYLPWPSFDAPENLLGTVLTGGLQANADSQVISEDFTFPEEQRSPPVRTDHNPLADASKDENINQMIAQNRISMEDIIFAGLQSITRKFNNKSKSNPENLIPTIFTSYTPSPSTTHIPFRQMALMAACLTNAAHIGIDVYAHIRRPDGHSHSPSPFYKPEVANTAMTSFYQFIKPDLRPCAAQLKQPHSLYIDLFPFPSFRQRVLALKSCVVEGEEQVFDEDEFCRDLDADGIVCWGSDAEIGTGAPWDRRSWECRPWFLRKWWMVTGGADGEMGKQSRWWAEMRGEVFEEM